MAVKNKGEQGKKAQTAEQTAAVLPLEELAVNTAEEKPAEKKTAKSIDKKRHQKQNITSDGKFLHILLLPHFIFRLQSSCCFLSLRLFKSNLFWLKTKQIVTLHLKQRKS